MSLLRTFLLTGALALIGGAGFAEEPPFNLTEDGSAFVYRARPGDQPGTVAAMFGIGANELPAFLAANSIKDPTHIAVGQVFRVPNPLASRAADAEGKVQALGRELAEQRARADSAERELHIAGDATQAAEQQAARAARLERVWPIAKLAILLLILGLGGLIAVASAAVRKKQEAEVYASSLARDLDERRRVGLAERQESARRILDFEAKVRDLEQQLGSRARAPARRSPAGAR